MGISVVNETIAATGIIAFLLWFAVFSLIIFSIWYKPKKTYSFEKRKGASIPPLIIALIILVVLGGYIGVLVYQVAVFRF
ncbi:hypothetical protein D920_02074 [Enterococcus faecalis 13-SD-W-01]|nr:hypothetical protein D920_02074 [Enterococcus faecalis 13-SD-W-01]